MSRVRKHSTLTGEELRQTKHTLIQISHRLRLQVPSEFIEINRQKLVKDELDDTLDTLVSLRLVNSEHVVSLLKAVEQAIKRINDNSYGWCTECGEEIEKQVLLSNITESRCIKCKDEGTQ